MKINEKMVLILELAKEPISIKEIAEKSEISFQYLSQLIKKLKKEKLITLLGRDKNKRIIQTNKLTLSKFIIEYETYNNHLLERLKRIIK